MDIMMFVGFGLMAIGFSLFIISLVYGKTKGDRIAQEVINEYKG